MSQSRLRRIAARILGRVRNKSGTAAVEFSLVLPILVVLWIGGVEVTEGLSVDRRLNNLASALGDLVARSKTVTYGDVDQIFAIAPGAMYLLRISGSRPGCRLAMRITAVDMDASGTATVDLEPRVRDDRLHCGDNGR